MKAKPKLQINYPSPEDRQQAIEAAEGAGLGHLRPVFEAIGKGMTVLTLPPDAGPFQIPAHLKCKSWLALLTDGFTDAKGPSAYHLRSLRRLLKDADIFSVMVDAPQKVAYGAAVWAATGELAPLEIRGTMNVVIVETQEREAASWLGLADRYAPRAGKVVTRPPEDA